MLLSEINSHTRDKNIKFTEEGHLYTIEGADDHPISVTTLIHKYFLEFDADKIIDKMMSSSRWNKSKYYGMTKEQIKEKWNKDGEEASSLGTKMHFAIECFFNGTLTEQPNTKEFKLFLKFWMEFNEKTNSYKPYRTEWMVYTDSKKICGSIDMTLQNEKGEIIILDWKRSKLLKKDNPFQKGIDIFSHLDDCNYNHYTIQLNCYRYILEKFYGKKVVGLALVVLHPDNDDYIFSPVPFLDKEINDLFNAIENGNKIIAQVP